MGQHLVAEEQAYVAELSALPAGTALIGAFRHGLVCRPVQMADSSSDNAGRGCGYRRSVLAGLKLAVVFFRRLFGVVQPQI